MSSPRLRRARLVLAAALLAGALAAGTAAAAPVPQSQGTQAVPDCPKESRTAGCDIVYLTAEILDLTPSKHTMLGYSRWKGTLAWRMLATSRTFTAHLQARPFAVWGESLDERMIVTARCDGPCSAYGTATGISTPGGSMDATFRFTDNTKTVHTPEITLVLTGDHVGNWPGKDNPVTKVRCDDLIGGRRAGCVNADFIPTIATMRALPRIAANIRGLQKQGGYGVPGDKARALHRTWNQARIDANRNAQCARKHTGPTPSGQECDEYPFAATYEGGAVGLGHGWKWVPATEQRQQGGRLSSFYAGKRILDGDPFYVFV